MRIIFQIIGESDFREPECGIAGVEWGDTKIRDYWQDLLKPDVVAMRLDPSAIEKLRRDAQKQYQSEKEKLKTKK